MRFSGFDHHRFMERQESLRAVTVAGCNNHGIKYSGGYLALIGFYFCETCWEI